MYGTGRKRKRRLDHRSNKPRREVEDQGEKMMKKEEEDANVKSSSTSDVRERLCENQDVEQDLDLDLEDITRK